MSYISQTIVFILAIIGLLFKSTQTDSDGKTIYTGSGLPLLTKTGRVVVVLLTLSFVLSILMTWRKASSDDLQKNEAISRQNELTTQLNDVRQQNKGLKDGIGEIIKASASISEDQKKSFQSVLSEQEETGEGISKNIRSSAHLLGIGIDNTIGLLNLSTKQLDRSLNPLNAIKLSYWVEIDVSGPEFASSKTRLRRGMSEFIAQHPTFDSFVREPSDFQMSSGAGDQIRTISLRRGSKFYPDEIEEGLAYAALTHRGHVCLRRIPVQSPDPCLYWAENTGDLQFFLTPKDSNFRPERVEVDLNTYTLTVNAFGLLQNLEFTRSNGALLSFPDLPGSQIVVYLENEQPMKPIPGQTGAFRSYDPGLGKKKISIGAVGLLMEVNGRSLWLREPLLKKIVSNGKVYLYATLPEDLAQLQ